MSREEILEGNGLIAEFIGIEFYDESFESKSCDSLRAEYNSDLFLYMISTTRLKDLKYSSSWDWLVPVIKKISNQKHWSLNAAIEWLNDEFDCDGFYNVEDLFKAVVLYIGKNK